MDTNEYRASQLFDAYGECCAKHSCDLGTVPSDGERTSNVLTYVDETFEGGGVTTGKWIHGGTTTHVSDWHISTGKSHGGTHSLRSGDLNNKRGKSSDVTLTVDSSMGAMLKLWYFVDVSDPFDFFEIRVDGILKHRDGSLGSGWKQYVLGMQPGEQTISFHVVSPNSVVSIDRSVGGFGTGVVYVDDLEFKPITR